MSETRLITAPPGALDQALADALRAAKEPDPMAPVTILVGSTLLRPYLRRRLAELNGGHINVEVVTFAELGMRLGERALLSEGRTLLPPLASRVLAQQVARGSGGYFDEIADAPGFAVALRRLFGELREAEIDGTSLGLAATDTDNPPKIADTASLYTEHENRRAPFYDAVDCLVGADPAEFDAVALLVHGVWAPTATQLKLLGALMAQTPTTVLLPETSPELDAAHKDFREWLVDAGAADTPLDSSTNGSITALHQLQSNLFAEPAAPAPEDGTARLVSAPDPPREVVEAARACMRWARAGIPFHEMAITYRHSQRYRPLVQSVFDGAGIPIYVHEGTPLTERPLGRRAVGLLDLVDADLPRAAVMEFLTDAELPEATRAQHPQFDSAGWDSVTRRAGVVEGLEQWTTRPAAHFEAETERYAERGDDPPSWGDKVEPLTQFIEQFATDLDARPERATWSEHVAFVTGLLQKYIRDVEPISRELGKLAGLDKVSKAVEFDHFRAVARQAIDEMTFDDEDGAGGATAFARRGVNVLDINSMRHVRFKAVAVLGLMERSFPPPARQDALLLDSERDALNTARDWQIPLRAAGADPEPLQFALAVNAAREQIQLSYARTETNEVSPRLPSHFFRAAATALAGEQIGVEEMDAVPAGLRHRAPGNMFAARNPQEAIDVDDYDRALISNSKTRALGIACIEQLKPSVTAAIAARDARFRTYTLTPYDGVLDETARTALEKRTELDKPIGPTSLENYAECPYRYFLSRVLKLDKISEPEQIVRITPLDRGSLVHKVLELFLREATERPTAENRNKQLPRLLEIAAEQCDDYNSRGLTGLPTLWGLDRRAILEDLELWYDAEAADPTSFDLASLEQAFGFNDFPPLEITTEGVTLRFHGYIDRLEWSESTPGFRVIDYKTGKKYDKKDGQLNGGKALQLPIYMYAAAAHLNREPAEGEAQYFFATTKGGFERVSFTGDQLAARDADFRKLLSTFATGISEGDFHATPDGNEYGNCKYCDFTTLCDARRERIFELKQDDPRAQKLIELEEIK